MFLGRRTTWYLPFCIQRVSRQRKEIVRAIELLEVVELLIGIQNERVMTGFGQILGCRHEPLMWVVPSLPSILDKGRGPAAASPGSSVPRSWKAPQTSSQRNGTQADPHVVGNEDSPQRTFSLMRGWWMGLDLNVAIPQALSSWSLRV